MCRYSNGMPKAKVIEYIVNKLIFIFFYLAYGTPIYSKRTKEIRFLFNTLAQNLSLSAAPSATPQISRLTFRQHWFSVGVQVFFTPCRYY